MPARERTLRKDEIQVARLVFLNNLPYYKIRIADNFGLDDAPWTEGITSTFVIHLGPEGYRNAISGNPIDGGNGYQVDEIFIHELTHVWQGSHGFQWAYMADAISQRGMLGGNAVYDYLPGQDWDAYHAEQQAQIIQDWYSGAKIPNNATYPPMSPRSPLYRYITKVQTLPMSKPVTYDP